MWTYCPFCGNGLPSKADRQVEYKAGATKNQLDQFTSFVASAKVSELRKALKNRNSALGGNKAELKERLLAIGPEEMVFDF